MHQNAKHFKPTVVLLLQPPHKISPVSKQLVSLGGETRRLLTPTRLFQPYQNAKDLKRTNSQTLARKLRAKKKNKQADWDSASLKNFLFWPAHHR